MMYSCAVIKAGGGETRKKNCSLCETQPMIMNGTMIRNVISKYIKKYLKKLSKTMFSVVLKN